jgi:hypothetical protein
MVSDIVLLKELPDFIKQSVEAYNSCIAGASLKHEYINLIQIAGFQEVNIIDETAFPADCVTNDPTVKRITDELKIPLETVEDAINSAVSIKINGIKPIIIK